MSETPETDKMREEAGFDPEYPNQHEPFESLAEEMEISRNRWRSVAEQLEKFARTQKDFGPFKPVGEKHMIEGLAAFDSLRKEQL